MSVTEAEFVDTASIVADKTNAKQLVCLKVRTQRAVFKREFAPTRRVRTYATVAPTL
jgi:hypothetical protein